MNVAQAERLCLSPNGLRDNRLIGHRVGVGHGKYGGKAALGSSAGTGFDGLSVLAAWLAQVYVHIDQARQQHVAFGVDCLIELRA